MAAVEWFAIGGFVASFEAVKVQAQDTEPAIEVKVRADPSQLVILRGIAATMASQCNFDLDEIADVRLAVDEASSLLIVRAQPGLDAAVPIPGGARHPVGRGHREHHRRRCGQPTRLRLARAQHPR